MVMLIIKNKGNADQQLDEILTDLMPLTRMTSGHCPMLTSLPLVRLQEINDNDIVNASSKNDPPPPTQTSKGLADKVYLLPVTPDYVEQVCILHLILRSFYRERF